MHTLSSNISTFKWIETVRRLRPFVWHFQSTLAILNSTGRAEHWEYRASITHLQDSAGHRCLFCSHFVGSLDRGSILTFGNVQETQLWISPSREFYWRGI
ncbi:hypothetical protein M3J09_012098 [Ascochyta lentis]